tara:strand:- start:21805 stop:22779 length:975 start_codon:yes stop_codon:yes gene_type:complete
MERREVVSLTILNAEPKGYSKEACKILSEVGNVIEEKVSQENLIKKIKKVDVLIVRIGFNINKNIIESSNRLKYIISATTGLDHIDIKAAKDNGIKIISLKGENQFLDSIHSTSELTFTLILSLLRRINEALDHVKLGGWNRDQLIGNNLSGNNLGILGLGRIGKHIAKYGEAFNCRTGSFDPIQNKWLRGVKKFGSIDSLFKWSNILCIHIPLNDSTKNLIDAKLLKQLPRGAIIINTSRGGVWDEKAVIDLLKCGHLGGVATDVIQAERDKEKIKNSPMINYAKENKNMLITPHIGGATKESMHMTEVFIAKKFIEAYRKTF